LEGVCCKEKKRKKKKKGRERGEDHLLSHKLYITDKFTDGFNRHI
jgi:hypothetical protein